MSSIAPIKGQAVFSSLQGGRAIAALMVVLYHGQVVMSQPKYWSHSWSRYLYFGHSGVEFFFVLSGIVILHAHWNDLGKPSKLASYAWKRFRRIYPIYWIFLILTLGVYFAVPSFGAGYERDPGVIAESFLLIFVNHFGTVLPVAWTLYHEVMFYAVFGVMILNRKAGLICLSLWMATSLYFLVLSPPNLIRLPYVSPLHLLFGFGMGVVLFVRRSSLPGLPFALVGAAGFIACCVHEDLAGVESFLWDIAYGVNAALVLGGCMLMEKRGRLKIPALLKLLGDASYSIYLAHYLALVVVAKLIYPAWKRVPAPLLVPFAVMVVAAVAIGVGFHLWIEKPMLRILSKPRKAIAPARQVEV